MRAAHASSDTSPIKVRAHANGIRKYVAATARGTTGDTSGNGNEDATDVRSGSRGATREVPARVADG